MYGHCSDAFATVDYEAALGVIYIADYSNRGIEVYVDETRPRLQGTKLTTLELQRAGVPFHLQCDSAAAYLMSSKNVDACLIGANQVSAIGDVANKIGSIQLAIVANTTMCRSMHAFHIYSWFNMCGREKIFLRITNIGCNYAH
jgi:methylthioribose-1-phosphate isomerase